jgi:sulfopyruvate decarboxylase subunit beta
VQYPEEKLIEVLKNSGVDFTCSLPCEKIKNLLDMIPGHFTHLRLTREEEGIGVCAGAALSGKRPAMFVQSSGIGNMINALLSLTQFYELPLAIFVSRRGVYKEKIAAQLPMGQRLPHILDGADIEYTAIDTPDDLRFVSRRLPAVYAKNKVHAFLMSPAVWEESAVSCQPQAYEINKKIAACGIGRTEKRKALSPKLVRFGILEAIAPHLENKVVVCNLGFPSKELYRIRHRPSNFYMLGSMGMATPIGLGISLTSDKEVLVIDGDGSILMNPGALATAAHCSPKNLTILCIDNGAYGSTGDQPTLASSCVDLESVARGFGVKDTIKVSGKGQLIAEMKKKHKGLRFIHALALPGNKDLPNIPLSQLEIKEQVMRFLIK